MFSKRGELINKRNKCPYFRFTQYSVPWRQQRQDFGNIQLERLPSALEYYGDLENKDAEIERLELKVEALRNKLLKCALFMKQIEYRNIRNYDYLSTWITEEKYKRYKGTYTVSAIMFVTYGKEF